MGLAALAFMLLLVLTTGILRPAVSAAAPTERRVAINATTRRTPIVVTKVTLADTVVQEGRMSVRDSTTPFTAEDDWIQNLRLYLYNRTNKTVVFMQINLGFVENDGPISSMPNTFLTLGRRPPPPGVNGPSSGPEPISFLPGQTMVLNLQDYIAQIRSGVEPMIHLTKTRSLFIFINDCFFADGTLTSGDNYWRRDPQNPSQWLRMDSTYFPGDSNLSWPGHANWDGAPGERKKL
jgi:hypothetical protein